MYHSLSYHVILCIIITSSALSYPTSAVHPTGRVKALSEEVAVRVGACLSRHQLQV